MPHHVYKHLELTGSSTQGMEHAINTAIAKAAQSVRHMHWFQVVDTRGYIEGDSVKHWQVTIKIGFRVDDEEDDD